MSDLTNLPRLAIKDNNTRFDEPCAICGAWDEAPIGPAIFLEGTWSFVCDCCAQALAPALYEAVCAWHKAEEERTNRIGGWDSATVIDDGFDTDFWAEALR